MKPLELFDARYFFMQDRKYEEFRITGEYNRESYKRDIQMVTSNPSVLIVEDHAVVAAHQTALMKDAGFTVLASVADAEAALMAADVKPPDVAIIDVSLVGDINGITVGRELKRRHGTAIVFVTGHLEEAIRQTVDVDAAFIGKPFHDEEIVNAVKGCAPPPGVKLESLLQPDLGRKIVDLPRQPNVAFGQPAGLVRRQHDLNRVPHVPPFRVMVHRFRRQGDAGHESPRILEVPEFQRAADRISAFDHRPAAKPFEGRLTLGVAQKFYCHLSLALNDDRGPGFSPSPVWKTRRADRAR